MRKGVIFIASVVCFVSTIFITNLLYPAGASEGPFVSEEKATDKGTHKSVVPPVRKFAREMEQTMNNILKGILESDFDYIKQEADTIADSGRNIIRNFFLQDNRYLQGLTLNSQEREDLKKTFNHYVILIEDHVLSLKEAADTQDIYKVLWEYVGLLKSSCVDCHTKYRDR